MSMKANCEMLYRLCMLGMMLIGTTNFGLSVAVFLLGSAAVFGSWSADLK